MICRGPSALATKRTQQRLGLIDNLSQRGFEQRRVDRPADLQVLAKIVCRARRIESPERTKFQAGHPTGEADYSLVMLRLAAVLLSGRATTNTSWSVPFAETSWLRIILNQTGFIADAQSTRQARTLG